MEAVPRLLMLKVDLKEFQDYAGTDWMDGVATDETLQDTIKEQINKHIQNVYSDDPNKYKDCVSNFLELQSAAYRVLHAPDMEGCNTLKKYYGQLHYMQSRFPFVGDDALQVLFMWSDAFTGRYTQQNTFAFEQTAILFNLGAIHSYLGSLDTRASDEGTKISCVHFQCAAGFFQYISEHLDTTLSPDISQFMLKLYTNTMLGQGQECLLEKSMQDNRKNSIIAKICQQVVDYYELSLNSLSQAEAKQAMGDANKQWHRMLTFKVAFYSAIAKYYLGNDDWDQEKYGTGLAYFGSAMKSFADCVKLAKNLKGDFKSRAEEALAYSNDVFNGRHTSAKKDNEFIYHEKVPDPATLPPAKGASLVKPLPFDPSNVAVTGPDIFGKLVPLEAHLTASTYSEEKAKLLRPILAEVEENNSVLEQYKRAIDFDIDKLIKIDDDDRLDPLLVEHCAALSVDQTPIQELTKAIKELSNVYMDIDSLISETISLLEHEENDTKQVKEVCGKTVDSSDEIEKLKKELEVCQDVHEKAAQMNDDLHTAMKVHIDNLRTVSEGLEALKKACNFANTSELITEDDTEVITLMEKLCSKVSEMEVQRQSLVAQLRSQLEEDDVTSALMTNPGVDAEDLFKEELKKHDSVISYIKQNLTAQENILNAVTEANVRYAKIKKVVDNHKKKVQAKCNNFLLSCTDYTAAVKRCEEGTQFFREVLEQVKQTNERTVVLTEKNSKLRKIIIDKHEVKKPPPRPTAPKPKSAPVAKPGVSLFSSEELAELAADDMEEFNDPAFLQFLKMSGGLPSGMSASGMGGALPTRSMQNPSSFLPGGPRMPQSPTFAAPRPTRPPANISQRPPASYPVYPFQQAPGSHPAVAQHPPSTRSPQPQFSTLGQPINSARHNLPPQQQGAPPAAFNYQAHPPTSQAGFHGPSPQNLPQNQALPQQHQQAYQANQPQSFPQYRQPNTTAAQQQQKPPMLDSQQVAPPDSHQQPGQQASGQMTRPPQNYHQPGGQMSQLPQNYQQLGQTPSRFQQPQNYPQSTPSPQNYQQTPQSQAFTQPSQQTTQPAPFSQPQNYQNPMSPTNEPTFPQSKPALLAQNYPPGSQQHIQSQATHFAQPPQNLPHSPHPQVSQPPPQNLPHSAPPQVSQPPPQNLPHSASPQVSQPPPQNLLIASHPQISQPPSQNLRHTPHPQVSQSTPQNLPHTQPPQNFSHHFQPQGFQPSQNFSQPSQPRFSHPPQASQSQGSQPGQNFSQNINQHQISQASQNFPSPNQANSQPPTSQMSSHVPGHPRPQITQPPTQNYQQQRGQLPQNFPQASPNQVVTQPPQPQGYQQPPMQGNRPMGQPLSTPQNYQQPRTSNVRMPGPQGPVAQRFQQPTQEQLMRLQQQQKGTFAGAQQPRPQTFPQNSAPNQNYQPIHNQQVRHPAATGQPLPQRQQGPPQNFQQPSGPAAQYQAPRNPQPNFQHQQRFQGNQPPAPHQPNFQMSPQDANQPRLRTPVPSGISQQQGPVAFNQQSLQKTQQQGHAGAPNPQVTNSSEQSHPNYPAPNQTQQTTQSKPAQYQNMSEPLAPTVVGGVKLDPPLEPSKPSADLEGLTYIPSNDVLLPTIANTSSADELLTASPESDNTIVREQKTLLVPTKVDGEEMIVTRFDDLPYKAEADLMKLKMETENFQKQISSLLLKAPGTGTLCQLDKDWKQLSELQEKSARQQSTAVGRCSSYKNRFQDILPFDQNRIVLKEGKDDYINASMVDEINKYCPRFIATQSPLTSSCGDFWTMIHEEHVTLIVMLVGNNEIPKKCAKYWPTDRNVAQKHGSLSITFTTSRSHGTYTERTFTLKHAKSSLPRSLTQLQYTAWPDHGQPSSLHDLLTFMDVVSSFHIQQRSLQWPVVVHCENGVGHTGTFCAAYSCIKYVDAGLGIPNILEVVDKMRMKRKYMLQEKAQLKLVHDLVSIRAVELLKQRGVIIDNQPPAGQMMSKIASPPASAGDKANFDVFGSSGLSSIQASVEKMTVKSLATNPPPMPVSNVTNSQPVDAPIPADINALIGNNVSDLVQGTIQVQPTPETIVSSVKPDVISDCKDLQKEPVAPTLSTSFESQNLANGALAPSLSTNFLSANLSPPDQGIPTTKSKSLLDQLTPEAFTLGTEVRDKKRITKADFFKSDSGIGANKSQNDPFADLDPLWGLKK